MRSEHVVRVFDVGHLTSGQPFMVMEHLTGGDLGRLVQAGGSLPVEDAASYVLQACEAVAEAHAMGIVHRDLKPSNLFLAERADGSPIVKLLDFGISKVTAAEGFELTATDATVGSPLFMSPEQIRGSKDIDHRTDIWSLGVVLYELLAGRPPFGAPSLSALAVVIATEAPTSLREHRSGVPEALNALMMKCLEKLPEQRFQTVAELARALAPFAPKDAARLVERIVRISTRNNLADTVSTRAASQGAARGRVLLVDDDPALLRGYARQLRHSGWTVDEAGEGREALARLGGSKFDVIVTDIDMPALSGVELLRVLRARNDRTPVVLMTGGPSVGTAIAAVELGAFRYLLKPIESDGPRRRLAAGLRARRGRVDVAGRVRSCPRLEGRRSTAAARLRFVVNGRSRRSSRSISSRDTGATRVLAQRRAVGHEVVGLSPFIDVFVEGGDDHPRLMLDAFPGCVRAGVLVREAKDLAEEPVEVCTQPPHRPSIARASPREKPDGAGPVAIASRRARPTGARTRGRSCHPHGRRQRRRPYRMRAALASSAVSKRLPDGTTSGTPASVRITTAPSPPRRWIAACSMPPATMNQTAVPASQSRTLSANALGE
jgi:DNA-binding response OmpR family regulator